MKYPNYRKWVDYSLLLPSLIPLLVLFLYPLIVGISLVFHTSNHSSWTISNIVTFFSNPFYYSTIQSTFTLVFPASLIEIVLAFAMAYFLRKKIPFKQFWVGMIIFPLTLGPLIVAVGMINFFQPNGWFNHILVSIHFLSQPLNLLYNYWGAFIALTILGIAFIFSNLIGLIESVDPSVVLAANSLGANSFSTFWKVFFPLVKSGVITVYTLNLIMQLAVFESAILLGNPASDTHVFSVVAFQEATQYFNYNMATTVAFIMAITQLLSVVILNLIKRRGYVGSTSSFK